MAERLLSERRVWKDYHEFPNSEALVSALDRATTLLHEAAEMREALEKIGHTITAYHENARSTSHPRPHAIEVLGDIGTVARRAILNTGEE